MRDFFITFSLQPKKRINEKVISYFDELFPDSENAVIEVNNLSIAYSHDPGEGDSGRNFRHHDGEFLVLLSGEFELPDHLTIPNIQNSFEQLVSLFKSSGEDIFKKISGNFNVVIYYIKNQRVVVINSKLGLYPAYYYKNDSTFYVSTRLGLFKRILKNFRENHPVVFQHCIYNYPISNDTFIKDVQLMPAASSLSISNNNIIVKKYWDLNTLLASRGKLLNPKESIRLIDNVMDKIIQRRCGSVSRTGISLTGGWDGRLILAYALKYLSPNDILLYSHGTKDSPDVSLPLETSKKLKFNYVPVYLEDKDYVDQQLEWASRTILYSDGMRSLTRLHYLYNMHVLKTQYGLDSIISGIGGSNLIKSSNYQPSTVFNKYIIELIESDNPEKTISKQHSYFQEKYPDLFADVSLDDFLESFTNSGINELYAVKNKNERFFRFLVMEIERRYFGAEIQSYKHLLKNFSPFFCDEFIEALITTDFISFKESKGLFKSRNISLFYAQLINRHNKNLAKENTDRGFSMYDVGYPHRAPIMIFKYMWYKYAKSKKVNYFNNQEIALSFSDKYSPRLSQKLNRNELSKSVLVNFISVENFLGQ